jgi:WD40 repeat protein
VEPECSDTGHQLPGFSDEGAILWDATTGKRQAVLPFGGQMCGMAWSPDGKTLATGSPHRTVTVWNAETGKLVATLRGHTGHIFALAWSPDGKTLATGADDNLVILWDARSGQARSTLKGHSSRVVDVGWSPDGKTLASGSDDSTLLWDLASEKPRATLSGSGPRWSPDGKQLATLIGDTAILWEESTATERAKLKGHANDIRCLAWSPDGKMLATGSGDVGGFWRGAIPDRLLGPGSAGVVWDATTFKARFKLIGHRHHIESLA